MAVRIRGRTVTKTVAVQRGLTILDHAIQQEIDVGFSCVRGTCARCRCFIVAGVEALAEPTDAEWDRLTDEELAEGYRLGCQAVIWNEEKEIDIVHKPYF